MIRLITSYIYPFCSDIVYQLWQNPIAQMSKSNAKQLLHIKTPLTSHILVPSIVPPLLSHSIVFPCPCVPAVVSVSAPEMLHDDVVAWMQQVRKAVQSVSEHNGSEYNSLLQQIRSKVCWDQSYCAWGKLKHWTGGVPCIVASCSHTTHPSSSSSCPSSLLSGGCPCR